MADAIGAGALAWAPVACRFRVTLRVDDGRNIFIIGGATFLSSKEVIPEVHEDLATTNARRL